MRDPIASRAAEMREFRALPPRFNARKGRHFQAIFGELGPSGTGRAAGAVVALIGLVSRRRFISSRSQARAWRDNRRTDRRTAAASRASPAPAAESATMRAGSPGARRRDLDLKIDARDALDRVDHFEHREAVTVAAIERLATARRNASGEAHPNARARDR